MKSIIILIIIINLLYLYENESMKLKTPLNHIKQHSTNNIRKLYNYDMKNNNNNDNHNNLKLMLKNKLNTNNKNNKQYEIVKNKLSKYCGLPHKDVSGKAWFTQNGCSLASTNITFIYDNVLENGNVEEIIIQANKGDIIPLSCESLECPIVQIPDCYELGIEICNDDEFCFIDEHEKWGKWAMGINGKTPSASSNNDSFCSEYNYKRINQQQDPLTKEKLLKTFELTCHTGVLYTSNVNPW